MSGKEAYQEKMEAQLKAMAAEIAELKAKAATANADVKGEYEKHLAQLHAHHSAAHSQLEAVKIAGAAAWEELKTSLEMAVDQIRQSLKHAAAKFK